MIERVQAIIAGIAVLAVPVGAVVTLVRPHTSLAFAYSAALAAFWLCALWAKWREKRMSIDVKATQDAA